MHDININRKYAIIFTRRFHFWVYIKNQEKESKIISNLLRNLYPSSRSLLVNSFYFLIISLLLIQ